MGAYPCIELEAAVCADALCLVDEGVAVDGPVGVVAVPAGGPDPIIIAEAEVGQVEVGGQVEDGDHTDGEDDAGEVGHAVVVGQEVPGRR